MLSNKINLQDEDVAIEPSAPVIITFTKLYTMKQSVLEELVKTNGAVYINCKDGAPLKITTATLG